MIGSDCNHINGLKIDLISCLKIINIRPTSYYLGIEVIRENNTITVMQTIYFDWLLAAYQMPHYNTVSMSMVEELCLVSASDGFEHLPTDVIVYKRFTGSIQWFACQTRLAIIWVVGKLS